MFWTERLITEVRTQCGNPDPYSPSDDLILQVAEDSLQTLHNEMQNQQPGWSLDSWIVPMQLFDQEQLVAAPRFGKPTRVHTVATEGEEFLRNEPLTIVRMQELPLAENCSATERQIAFYYRDNALRFQVMPPYSVPTSLKIWYETGEAPDLSLSDTPLPMVPQYHRYLRTLTSIGVLPYCEWSRLHGGEEVVTPPSGASWRPRSKQDEFRARRAELTASLMLQEQRERRNWQLFAATGWQDGDGGCRPYADWME